MKIFGHRGNDHRTGRFWDGERVGDGILMNHQQPPITPGHASQAIPSGALRLTVRQPHVIFVGGRTKANYRHPAVDNTTLADP